MAVILGLFVVGVIVGMSIMWVVSNLLGEVFQDKAADSEIRDIKKEFSRLDRENKRLDKKNDSLVDMLDDIKSVHRTELRNARREQQEEHALLEEQVEILKDRKVELENALAREKLDSSKEGK